MTSRWEAVAVARRAGRREGSAWEGQSVGRMILWSKLESARLQVRDLAWHALPKPPMVPLVLPVPMRHSSRSPKMPQQRKVWM